MSRFNIKTEAESNFRNAVFLKINRTVFLHKDRKMDNVQKYNQFQKYYLIVNKAVSSSNTAHHSIGW
jgi:hypothetical protein